MFSLQLYQIIFSLVLQNNSLKVHVVTLPVTFTYFQCHSFQTKITYNHFRKSILEKTRESNALQGTGALNSILLATFQSNFRVFFFFNWCVNVCSVCRNDRFFRFFRIFERKINLQVFIIERYFVSNFEIWPKQLESLDKMFTSHVYVIRFGNFCAKCM